MAPWLMDVDQIKVTNLNEWFWIIEKVRFMFFKIIFNPFFKGTNLLPPELDHFNRANFSEPIVSSDDEAVNNDKGKEKSTTTKKLQTVTTTTPSKKLPTTTTTPAKKTPTTSTAIKTATTPTIAPGAVRKSASNNLMFKKQQQQQQQQQQQSKNLPLSGISNISLKFFYITMSWSQFLVLLIILRFNSCS